MNDTAQGGAERDKKSQSEWELRGFQVWLQANSSGNVAENRLP